MKKRKHFNHVQPVEDERRGQVAATITTVTLRPYECTRLPNTYHLTSKPAEDTNAD